MSHKKLYKKSEADVLLKCQNVCRVSSALFAFLWSIQHWIAVSEYPLDFLVKDFIWKHSSNNVNLFNGKFFILFVLFDRVFSRKNEPGRNKILSSEVLPSFLVAWRVESSYNISCLIKKIVEKKYICLTLTATI